VEGLAWERVGEVKRDEIEAFLLFPVRQTAAIACGSGDPPYSRSGDRRYEARVQNPLVVVSLRPWRIWGVCACGSGDPPYSRSGDRRYIPYA
jgi:hypothetical protein